MDKAIEWLGAALGLGIAFIGIPMVIYAITPDQSTAVESSDTPTSEVTPIENSEYVDKHGTSDCTSDCSGHDAGYEWAQDNDICDPSYDNGNSNSFNEGVQAYAYDNCYYGDGDNPF